MSSKRDDEIMLKRLRELLPEATPAEIAKRLIKARGILAAKRLAKRREKVRFAVEMVTHVLSLGILGFTGKR